MSNLARPAPATFRRSDFERSNNPDRPEHDAIHPARADQVVDMPTIDAQFLGNLCNSHLTHADNFMLYFRRASNIFDILDLG